MIWLLALLLLASVAALGYRQGAIKVGFSTVGIVLGALVAVPLGRLLRPLLGILGLKDPLTQYLIAPIIVFLVVSIIFKVVAAQVQQSPKMIGVRVGTPAAWRNSDTALRQLLLRAPDGHLFPLERVATIAPVAGQPQIESENLKRMVAVTGRISGRDLGSTIADVKQVLAQPDLLGPSAYTTLGGLYHQQQIAFQGLMTVFAAAVALVFALLLFLYERFRIAAAILAMPLLAAGSVFIGLWVTGIELNITSMMGMTMIVGIVTEVAIFYVSEYFLLREREGMAAHEALVAAGANRLRPIAMTTIAAILALSPLALAVGEGSAMQQPLAVAIITGLIVQMPLVLVLLPALIGLTLERAEKAAITLS